MISAVRVATAALLSASVAAFVVTSAHAQSSDVAAADDEGHAASALDRPALLTVEEVPLAAGLGKLRERSGVALAFSPSLLPATHTVSCFCTDVTVKEALDRLLTGTSFRYAELGTQVLIEPAEERAPTSPRDVRLAGSAFQAAAAPAFFTRINGTRTSGRVGRFHQQEGTITGRVVDAQTERPLSGAQVFVQDTNLGTLTDTEGEFTLSNVPAGDVTVRVQLIGYRTGEQTVAVVEGETVAVNFSLSESAVALDEIVVTAAGEARAREIGTSLSRISAADIENAPVRNPQDVLAGRAAGVTVLGNSGQPGAGGTIRLRGNNSITQGNNPIIYVDGVRIFSGDSPGNTASGQSTLPLNDINAADIERIEIIKGAAATTLYGTEASAGVIQIFTQRGFSGATTWQGEVSAGINAPTQFGSSTDPTGMFLRECRGPNLVTSDGQRFEDPSCPESGSWLRSAPVQRHSLSVRGGTEAVQYYLSGGYGDDHGVVATGGSKDGGIRGNFSFQPFDDFQVSLNSSYTARRTNWIHEGNNASSLVLNVSRGSFGNFSGDGCTDPEAVCLNNGDILTANNSTATDHFITGLTLEHDAWEEVTNRLTVGWDYNSIKNEAVDPFGYQIYPAGRMNAAVAERTLLSTEYVGTWQTSFGEALENTFSWGGQMFEDRNRSTSMNALDFAGPGIPTLTSAARRDVTGDSRLRVINAGLFVQEMLGWNDQLFVTAGLRVDGNSAFGQDFGLQPYPKISLSYVASDLGWWPSDWWNRMRVRAAVGESGKAPGAFDAVRTWAPIAGDDGQPGFSPSQIGNPELGPERSREYEAGFEAGFMNDRLGLDITFFNQNTFDALLPVTYPPTQGFLSSQLENVGSLQNTGFEARVDAVLLRNRQFDWRTFINYSVTRSEAIDLNGQDITVATFGRTFVREGYPVPAVFGNMVVNADAYEEPEIVQDTFLGPSYPPTSVGLGSTLQLGDRLTLDALGEFQMGAVMVNGTGYQNARRGIWYPCYEAQARLREAHDDPAALAGVTALDRARCTLGDPVPNYDYWVESTDFFKLRSMSLSYQLPNGWVPGTESAVLTLAGRNLFTSTQFSGPDPEVDDYRTSLARRDYYNMPPYRTINASLRVNF